MEPHPPPWGWSWAQDKSSRAARSTAFREKKMVDEDSHSTDLCLGWTRSFNIFIGSLHFFFFRTKLFSNAGYAEKLHKILRNLNFVVQVAYFSIRPKKVFCFFRATFEQLSLQKATFDCFLSNFWATFWEIRENFLKYCEQLVESPNHSWNYFIVMLTHSVLYCNCIV